MIALLPADRLLHLLLRGDHLQPRRSRRQHEEVRWLHPGHPGGPSHRRVPRVTCSTAITWPGSLYLGLIALVPTVALRSRSTTNAELPVRRHQHPDHGRCGAGDREADREPAAAAQLRRVPPLMRIVLRRAARRGQGHAGRVPRRDAVDPAHLHRRPLPRQHQPGTALGLQAKEYMDAGELRARRGDHRHGARTGCAEPDAEPTASCSTASRATSPRPRRWTLLEHDMVLDAVLDLEVPEDEVVADRRPSDLPQRQRARLPRRVQQVDAEGVCDVCGGELYQRDDDSRGDGPQPAGGLPQRDRADHRLLQAAGPGATISALGEVDRGHRAGAAALERATQPARASRLTARARRPWRRGAERAHGSALRQTVEADVRRRKA